MVLPARDEPADRRDRVSDRCSAERLLGVEAAAGRVPDGRRCERPAHGAGRRTRPTAARAPCAAPRAERPRCRSRHVVGRRPRRATARSGVVPRLVRRRRPGGRHLHRAGLDADVLVRRAGPAFGARPGDGLAARPRRARPGDRSRPAVVHGDAGRPDRRRRTRAGDRGAHVRRLSLRGRPGDAVDVVPHGEPPRRAPRTARRSRTASSPTLPSTRTPMPSTATSMRNSRRCCRRCRLDPSASATGSDGPTATS